MCTIITWSHGCSIDPTQEVLDRLKKSQKASVLWKNKKCFYVFSTFVWKMEKKGWEFFLTDQNEETRQIINEAPLQRFGFGCFPDQLLFPSWAEYDKKRGNIKHRKLPGEFEGYTPG